MFNLSLYSSAFFCNIVRSFFSSGSKQLSSIISFGISSGVINEGKGSSLCLSFFPLEREKNFFSSVLIFSSGSFKYLISKYSRTVIPLASISVHISSACLSAWVTISVIGLKDRSFGLSASAL